MCFLNDKCREKTFKNFNKQRRISCQEEMEKGREAKVEEVRKELEGQIASFSAELVHKILGRTVQ